MTSGQLTSSNDVTGDDVIAWPDKLLFTDLLNSRYFVSCACILIADPQFLGLYTETTAEFSLFAT